MASLEVATARKAGVPGRIAAVDVDTVTNNDSLRGQLVVAAGDLPVGEHTAPLHSAPNRPLGGGWARP